MCFYIVIKVSKKKTTPVELCLDRKEADDRANTLNNKRSDASVTYQVWARNHLKIVRGKIDLNKSL